MNIKTLGKIELTIGIIFILGLIIANIYLYYFFIESATNIGTRLYNILSFTQKEQLTSKEQLDASQHFAYSAINLVNHGIIFLEILIIGDILILLLAIKFVIDGLICIKQKQ